MTTAAIQIVKGREVRVRTQLIGGVATLAALVGISATEAAADYRLGPMAVEAPSPDEVPFAEPPVLESEDGMLDVTLQVVLVDPDGRPLDCDTPAPEAFRAYKLPADDRALPTGPTLRFDPGDAVRVAIDNRLCPGDDESMATLVGAPPQVMIDQNRPHGADHTNLHTHGLWVSPAGNSDNVLNVIPPGTRFQHEYLIPADHVPGTHWYHPHKHGSVQTQVRTGMAGALIMRGGIDQIGAIARATERLMVIQHFVPVEVAAEQARLLTTAAAIAFPPGEVTTINGLRAPTITTRPGQVERWRIIAAIADNPLALEVVPSAGGGRLPLHVIAYDGIPVTSVDVLREEALRLFPGNRADVMVRFEEEGDYAITNGDDTIGYVRVEGEPVAAMEIPSMIDEAYTHPSLLDAAVDRNRALLFSVLRRAGGGVPQFLIDGKEFDPNRVDQHVRLDQIEEWRIENNSTGPHPFHIHVNPFQIVDSSDPIYRARRGDWLDTAGIPPLREDGAPGYLTIRAHFKRFIGRYVLHCHFLGHEDRGMMQIVEVY